MIYEFPETSIIVPTYNRKELLKECINHLTELDYPKNKYEILVIDDGSTDGTERLFLSRQSFSSPPIRYEKFDKNYGAAAARNFGIGLSKGEFVAFVDDDCRVLADWLRQIVYLFRQYPDAAAVGGSIVNGTESPLGWASYILDFSSWLPSGKTRPVNNIPACNVVYKKQEILGSSFPEDYKNLGFEDSLFNYALVCAKKTIIFSPEIKVIHYRDRRYFAMKEFYYCQKRYALGFLKGGYKVFGIWGRLLMAWPVLNLLCLRLIAVFLRCLKSTTYVKQFILNFGLIFAGEWERNKVIYFSAGSKYA